MKFFFTTLAVAVLGLFAPTNALPAASSAAFFNTTTTYNGTTILPNTTVSTASFSTTATNKYANTTANSLTATSTGSVLLGGGKGSGSQATAIDPNNKAVPATAVGASSNGKSVSGQGSNAQVAAPKDVIVTVTITAPAVCTATGPAGLKGGSGNAVSNGASPSGSSTFNGKYEGSGTSSANASTASSAYVAPSTLLPAVHWDHPLDSLDNLKPGESHQLYYSDSGVADPAVEHLFASLSTTLQHAAVILDHSAFVKSASCAGDGILVTFTSKEAFDYAATAWQAVPDFVLVTYTNGCGVADNQRTFWLINGVTLQSGSNAILAKVSKEIGIEEALDDVDLVWGTYYPPGSNSTGTPFGGSNGGSTPGSNGTGNSTLTGAITGNSTSNYGSSCGAAPSSTIDGFPAAACGADDFDKQLDDAIGYFDMTNPTDYGNDVKDLVPDVDFDSEDLLDDGADGDFTKRALRKQGLWGWIRKAVKSVVKIAVKVATAPLKLAATAIKAIPIVGNSIAKATEFDPSISVTDIKLGPSNSATSPWGPAAQMYQKESSKGKAQADVTLYCVDCGIKGHVMVAGVAKWNLLDGLKALNANMKANMEAGLNLGLVATTVFSDEKKKPLINQAIPNLGMSVKGIFSAGVFVDVDAVAKMNIKAEGQALIGVTMSFPNFEATMDLIGDGSKVTGYEPQFKKRFEASGTISADARLSLPISFNLGIEIIPISFKKAISLIEEPSLFGNITFAGSTPGQPPANETCNDGFKYFANAQNDIKLNLFDIETITLNHYDSPPLLQGCKLLASPAASSGSSSTQASASSTEVTGSPEGQTSSGDSSASGTAPGSSEPTESADGQTPTSETGSFEPTAYGDGDSTPAPEPSPIDSSGGSSEQYPGDATPQDSNISPSDGIVTKRNLFRRQNSTATSSSSTIIEDDGEDDFGSNPSDPSTDLDPSDRSLDNDTAAAQAGAESATTNGGFTYTTIVESHNAFSLIPGDDGNLYAGDPSTGASNGTGLFGTYDGVAAIDDSKRVMHYYPDVMAAYGVSRLRLSDEDKIPKSAEFVVLQPLDADGDGSVDVLFAVDTKGDAFGLVLCGFENGGTSKLFAVSGEDGVSNLMKESLRFTVTGAPVSNCDPVALVLGKTE